MSCGADDERLALWVQGELDDPALAAHVAACGNCARQANELRALVADLRSAAAADADPPRVPTTIGPYRIIRLIGRGGMGEVYEAQQLNPQRRVALKVLQRDRSGDPLHARLFAREVRALAQLAHPGIAAIFEAGQTQDGRDYFAMELVAGVDLRRYAMRAGGGSLTFRGMLELFAAVCDAAAYAHQRGIVHRDLKPENILIVTDDSAAERAARPKILDFGLARITDSSVATPTVTAETGRILGTLAYMSPEQTLGDPDAIDLRADVYALGVILYELLTGALPIDVRGQPLATAVRAVCEQTPPPPRRFAPRLPADVQTIILTAIEKDRARRYASAAELRDDVQRYLRGLPIAARPATLAYRTARFVARHALPVSLLSALAVSLLAFATVSTLQAWRLAAERDRVQAESRKVAAINNVLESLLESADPWALGGRDVTVLQVLDGAARQIELELADSPLIAAAVRNTLGNTYRAFSAFDAAERHLTFAVDARRQLLGANHLDTARSLNDLAELRVLQGRLVEARALLAAALQTRRALLPPGHEDLAVSLNNAGLVHKESGEADAARALYEQALAIRRDRVAALANDDRAALRDLAIARNQLAQTLNNLAALARSQRRLDAAEGLYREALALRLASLNPDHPDVAKMHNNLGKLLLDRGDARAAAEEFRRALRLLEPGLGDGHQFVATARYNLALALESLEPVEARQLAEQARRARAALLGEAHEATREALALCERLAGNP